MILQNFNDWNAQSDGFNSVLLKNDLWKKIWSKTNEMYQPHNSAHTDK